MNKGKTLFSAFERGEKGFHVFPHNIISSKIVIEGKTFPFSQFDTLGNESVPADSITSKRLVLKGSGKTYDSLSSGYKFSESAFTKLRSVFRTRVNTELTDSDFISFGLVDEKGYLTNAGALLADDALIKQSRLFCTR